METARFFRNDFEEPEALEILECLLGLDFMTCDLGLCVWL